MSLEQNNWSFSKHGPECVENGLVSLPELLSWSRTSKISETSAGLKEKKRREHRRETSREK